MDYVLVSRIYGVPVVLLVGAGVHFFKASDPGCVEDVVDLGES